MTPNESAATAAKRKQTKLSVILAFMLGGAGRLKNYIELTEQNRLMPCIHCRRITTKGAHFKLDGLTKVERYCDDCLNPEKFADTNTFRIPISLL